MVSVFDHFAFDNLPYNKLSNAKSIPNFANVNSLNGFTDFFQQPIFSLSNDFRRNA